MSLETVQIDNKRPTLMIATPMYGGMCAGFYAQSLLQAVPILKGQGIDTMVSFMFNESLITRARNAMAHGFMKSDATHLMFIDADIKFNPADIAHMVKADKEIICGIYPKKEINWKSVRQAIEAGVEDDKLATHTGSFVVNRVGYEGEVTVPMGQPCEIWNGGTGFMLIKRGGFEALRDKVPTYTNDMILIVDKNPVKKIIHEYFATSIDEPTNRLLSEDYHFCKLARQNGFKVYAAPWATLTHSGTYNFSGQLPRG